MKNSIFKKMAGLLLVAVCLFGLVGCGTHDAGNGAPGGADDVIKRLMVKELPEWASGKECKDVTFIIYKNRFESCLESAEVVTGTYTYDELTGEYALSNGAKLTETSEGYTYTNGKVRIDLVELTTKSKIGVLSGDANILASGVYNMTITFNVTLYDDHTFAMSNLASPTVVEGSWSYDKATGKYALTAEGMEVLKCSGSESQPSIKIKSSITGSDGNVYEFEVTVTGTVKG